MRRFTSRIAALAAAAALALSMGPSALAEQSDAHRTDAPAYFVFTDITREEAVLQLDDPAKIQHARDLIAGVTQDRPHVMGKIIKRQAPYNPRWSYHYNPETVDFFDLAIEVCDATLPYVEDHLDEAGGAFLPGLYWCPWTSRLIREVPPQ
ncbi:calmodulin-binding protein [Actinomadura rubrisoli]|uniref:Calmodulin-binding protein n=1 Tax=Actinomadura rubrisoli TaxID=2530368 RepID=A0A4R5ATZ0_9ACTN|nr:calmodulin-binding protein [Actinomadura rubrisoli]TDD74584.1 calmodulin-binding protein [Actinomadura rubrisoli]